MQNVTQTLKIDVKVEGNVSDWKIILLLNWKSKESRKEAAKQRHTVDSRSASIIRPKGARFSYAVQR